MTTAELFFLAVVAIVGLSARRNLTAMALVCAYAAVQGLYHLTGSALEPEVLLCIDMAIIAVIYCKPETPHPWCRHGTRYRSFIHHLCAFWLEKSVSDRIVLTIFPAIWTFYLLPPDAQWWPLYWLSLAQFAAAGAEPFANQRSPREAKRGPSDVPRAPPGAEFAIAWSERGYG